MYHYYSGSSEHNGSSEQAGYGKDASLSGFIDPQAASPNDGQYAQVPLVGALAIGKLRTVKGEVTVKRANVIVAQPTVNDLVYQGDVIETGLDGLVGIVFVDGTTFHLHAGAHMVLDEFIYGAEKLPGSALFRVVRGLFGVISGKVATVGRLIIDTPVAQIQNIRPAAGIGSLAFSVFTIGFIHELKAASADIALLDDGTITCKDFKHGVFEIITKGDHPQRFIVDDPCVSFDAQLRGAEVRVSQVANTVAQMAQFHNAFLGTLDTYLRGQQDAFIQQHANANPQSTTVVGSSDPPALLNAGTGLGLEKTGQPTTGNSGNSGSGSTAPTTPNPVVVVPQGTPPPSSDTFTWNGESGSWDTPPDWKSGSGNTGKVPDTSDDTVIINPPGPVTYGPPDSYSIGTLIIEPGATLDIVGGTLAVKNLYIDPGATLNQGPGSLVVDPLEVAEGATYNLMGSTVTGASAGIAGIFDSTGTSAVDVTAIAITTTGLLEATAGTLTIGPGSIANSGELLATTGSTLVLNGLTVTNTATGTIVAADGGTLELVNDTVTGGTIELNGASAATRLQIDGTVTLDGSGAVQLTNYSGNAIVSDGTDTATLINHDTITGAGTIGDGGADNLLTLQNYGTIDATDTTPLILYTGNPISNEHAGTLEATLGGTLDLKDALTNDGQVIAGGDGSEVVFEGAVTNNADGTMTVDSDGTFDVKTDSISNADTTDGIEVDGTFKVDVGADNTLTLSGDGELRLVDGTITGATGAETLVNDSNNITGYGLIEQLALLQNDGAGTIDANVANETLTIDTGNTVTNAGLMEATLGGTLDLKDALTNDGQVTAGGDGSEVVLEGAVTNNADGTMTVDSDGTFDVKTDSISNADTTDGIEVDGTFKVDVGADNTLTLSGDGELRLVDGTITGATGAETLVNDSNNITGYGLIEQLALLQNDGAGTIDANVANETLTIDTGNTVTNAGLMEATLGGTLDVQDPVNNSGLLKASGGSELDITGPSISWTGTDPSAGTNGILLVGSGDTLLVNADDVSKTLTLNGAGTGQGAVSLGAGSQIIGTAGQTLDNVNNDISGAGTIGNGIGADLTLNNDSAGTIDANVANETLTIDTGNTVTNAGLMEATLGGTLDLKDALTNDGQVTAGGDGSEVVLEGAVTNNADGTMTVDSDGTFDVKTDSISNADTTDGIEVDGTFKVDVGADNTLTLSGDGELRLVDGTITGATGAETLVNDSNNITGYGLIEQLALLQNDGAGTIDANVANETLTIDTGNTVTNAGLMEATLGGILQIDDNVTNTGTLLATGDGLLVLDRDTITNFVGITNGTTQVNDGSMLDFEGSNLNGGIVNVFGLFDSTGTSAIDGAAITIAATTGLLETTGGTLTIDAGSIANDQELLATNDSTLALESLTVTDTATASVEVAAGSTIDLESATISDGTVTVDGTLDSTGTSAIDGAAITIAATTGLLETTGGTLTIDAGSIANDQELLATNDSTLALESLTVTDTATASVEVAAGSTIDLESATISDGTVTVDGTLDSTGTSAIDGAAITIAATTGLLETTGGTLTIDAGSIANDQELLATNDSTLALESLTVTDTATASVEVAAGSTIDLESATISDGTVTVDGTLDSTGTSAIDGAAITIAATTGLLETTGGTLTIDAGSIANDQELLATNDSTLALESLTVTDTATASVEVAAGSTIDLESATISDGTVTVDGTLDSTGTSAIDGAAITIAATTGLLETTGGTLTIDAGSIANDQELLATNDSTLALESLTVTDTATASVEVAAGSTIDLESATISDGTVTVDGTLDSTGTSAIDGAAITIAATTGLLETTGGTLTIDAGSIANDQELLATNDSTLALESLTVTDTATASVEVAAGSTIDLESATISDGTVTVDGTLDSTGTSAIDGAAITIAATTGLLETTGGTLTIDAGSIANDQELLATNDSTLALESLTVTDTATASVEVAAGSTIDLESATISDGTVTVDGTLDSTGTSAIDGAAITIAATTGLLETTGGTLTIDAGSIANDQELLATNDSTLALESLTVTDTATASVEVAAGSTIDLESATISDGTVTVDGTLDSTGTSAIDGAAITIAATTGLLETTGGTLTIDAGSIANDQELLATNDSTLALESLTVTDTATASVEVAAGSTIDLESATISDGTVTVDGTLDSTGTSAIDGAAITIAATTGLLETTGGTLTIDAGSIANDQELLATNDSTLALESLTVTDTATASVEVAAGSTIDLESATISDGTVRVDGTLDSTGTSAIDGAAITIAATTGLLETTGGTLTIDAGSIANDQELLATNDSTLALESLTVTDTATASVEVAAGSTIDLESATISDGTVTVDGTLDSTGTSAIDGAAITIAATTGLLETTGGTLTIDAGSIANAGTLEASGAQLDLVNLTVINTGTVEAIGTDGIVDLQSVTITGGAVSTGTGDVIEATVGTNTISDGTVNNAGTIEAIDGSTLTIDPSTVTNIGTLEATNTGVLIVDSSVNNSHGTIDVEYGSAVDMAGSVSGGSAVIDGGTLTYGSSSTAATSFDGFGMFVVDGTNASNHFTATLSDFGNGDIIDLPNIAYSSAHLSYNSSADTLTVSDGSLGPSITIQLAGSYAASNFVLSNDGNGDAEVTFTAGEAHEAPTLWLDGTKATVSEEGTVTLPSIRVIRVDSDDTLTLTIAGLPTGASITDSADGKIFKGGSPITLTGSEVGSALTLNDGSNEANFTLTVTANNTTSGEAASSASQTIAVTVSPDAPAGVAGSPINLALANPSALDDGPASVTITGYPTGWQLNQGTNLGNGTWAVETNDLSALTVMTAAAYTGAAVLSVTETWTNADGTTGTATVADNVEAYVPGAPIFALAGNDTLTGAGGNTEYVFAQPIGNDTIDNFNVATDKIDLMGFAKIASFSDIQANIVENSCGDAVITIGAGETITLNGVNAASLTAADFVFNQASVVDNAGNMTVSDGAVLPLGGTIDNTGIIALNSTGDATGLQIVGNGVTLEGGGKLTLSDGAVNIVVGTGPNDTLTNVDNTISGAGQIGSGDGSLTLVNEAHGTIDANVLGGTLNLETGNPITNNGLLEATNGSTLQIDDPVSGGGGAIIAGGTLAFEAQSNVNVTFNNGAGGTTYGALVLADPSAFLGQISGFTGTAPDAAHSDVVDLEGFNYAATTFSEASSNGNVVLTAVDGSNVTRLTFDNFDGTLNLASDGNGGTLITDPPAASSANVEGAILLPSAGPAATYSETVSPEGSGCIGSFSLDPVIESNGSASAGWNFNFDNDQFNLAPGQTETQSYRVTVADSQDPAIDMNQTVSISIGGPGNDHFVFQPGIGRDTIVNFNPQADTIEINHFANIQNVQQLASLITDTHGDAVIELGHGDSITIPGVTENYLQAHLHTLVHLV